MLACANLMEDTMTVRTQLSDVRTDEVMGSVIDEVLEANRRYGESFTLNLGMY
jgi:hypothetical protein